MLPLSAFSWTVIMRKSVVLPAPFGPMMPTMPPGPRLGETVIDASHVAKAYGDNLLIEDMSFRLPPGGIVGIIGPNGAGKTTLFRMITGQEKADKGSIRLGETVKLGYVDQSRDTLDAKKSVFEEISGGNDEIDLGRRKMPARAYAALFNFPRFRPAEENRAIVGRRA